MRGYSALDSEYRARQEIVWALEISARILKTNQAGENREQNQLSTESSLKENSRRCFLVCYIQGGNLRVRNGGGIRD